MIRSAIWLAAALIVGAAFHAFTPKASACSCPPSTPELELEHADAVFLGELVSIRRIGQFPRNSDDHYTAFVDVLEFKASEIWKGHPYETIYVHTYPRNWDENVTPGGCDGGYRFWGGEGERFIVFVSDGSVSLGYCGKSTHESKALNYFAVYGKGRSPEPGSVGPMPPLPPDVFALPAENSTEPEADDTMPPPDISEPPAENSTEPEADDTMPPLPADIPEPPAENSTEPEAIDTMPSPPPDISEPPTGNSAAATEGRPPEPGSIAPMPSPPSDISAPPAENSPAPAGRCGLPLHSVSSYGDTAALIMIVGLPGVARLISRRRTRTSSRDA